MVQAIYFRYLILFFALPSYLCGLRLFRNGRMKGGNLGPPASDNSVVKDVQEKWFEQRLDHFNPTNEKTWKQRYQVNEEFFNPDGGCVFLMIGGEGEANIEWLSNGAWINYAKTANALLIQLEHRFYGQSHPTEDLSVENLQYLTSQQALADIATFIAAINQQYKLLPSRVKWIAFGGSYPGSLAAWIRFKYPHLIHAAVSSSGPLLAQLDFVDYMRTVTDALRTYSDDCVTAVQDGIDQIEVLLKENIGQQNLNSLFTLCDPIENSLNNTKDISNLFESIADNFAGVVQYNKDNRISNSTMKNITIDTVCGIMVNQSIGPPVNRLSAVNSLVLNASKEECLDYRYDKLIEIMKNDSWESEAAEGSRQWFYQTCTEFGFYQTSSGEPHTFGHEFPLDFFIQQCADIFGVDNDIYNSTFLEYAVNRTNNLYGGLGIVVSNVVFVHGTIDPWHTLGITETLSSNAPAILINGTAHCANMYPPRDEDLPQLKAARVQIEELINNWLNL